MSGNVKVFPRCAYLLAVAVAGFSLLFTVKKGVEANLVSLLGDAAGGGLREAASAMAASAKFLVRAESQDAARARLIGLGVELPASGSEHGLLKVLTPYARGFLSPSTRDLLERGEFAVVRDAAAARLFSPMPPVISPKDDPFLLFTDYVLGLSEPKGDWVAVPADLTSAQALAALAAVKGAEDVRCAGAPFHTAVASKASKKEINILSLISLACVMFLGWRLTRSLKFLPVLVAVLAAAFCMSSAAVFAFFGKPHVISFVFGTTLIGISVDYVYHALTASRSITRPLTISFVSTAACFLPLLFSDVEVLNQMAVFTVTGMLTVFAGVLAFGRSGCKNVGRDLGNMGRDPWKIENLWIKCKVLFKNKKIDVGIDTVPVAGNGHGQNVVHTVPTGVRLVVIMVMALLPLCVRMYCGSTPDKTDLSRFHVMDPYLAEGERILMEMSGGEGFIPSAEVQRHNADLVRRLFKAQGENYCRMVGLPLSVLELPGENMVFAPREHLENALSLWQVEVDGMLHIAMLILGIVFFVLYRRSFLDFVLPMLLAYGCADSMLALMGEDGNFFARICFFIFIGMGFDYAVFRRHASWSGNHEVRPDATNSAVLYSFLTSLIGFGLLSFTDFAVTRIMGVTLSVGLASSYLAAKFSCGISDLLFCRGKRNMGRDPEKSENNCEEKADFVRNDGGSAGRDPKKGVVWHEQREQCASLFWARFMWYSYAWFGKNFQKIIFVIGMPVIYLCSRSGRVALKKFYAVLSEFTGNEVRATTPRLFMHILRFAWGLMDKTDSCTLQKNPPKMGVRDDEGWKTFRDAVNSGKGAFVLCTHVGVVGVLPSLPEALKRNGEKEIRIPKVNAFQQMGHDAVFMKVFMEHFDSSRLQLHAVEDIGVETAVKMKDAIDRGELVIMAGDRVSARSKSVLRHNFMGRDCVWPKGVYRFAKLMESPVFAVTCVSTGWNRYEVHFAALDRDPTSMLGGFVDFLEHETLENPEQWYQFYDFFGGESAG